MTPPSPLGRSGILVPTLVVLAMLAGPGKAAGPRDDDALQFTPQGSVKRVRQAAARFPLPMIALGDPRAPEDPFTVECPETGSSRWVDSRTWAYDFTRDLPAGLRCRFVLREGVKALDGSPVGPPQEFRFDTGGPAILASAPYVGSKAIEEDQAFLLLLDAEVDPTSVEAHVGFEVEGVPERIAARVVTGPEHDAILATDPSRPEQPHVVVRAAQSFPNAARVTLVWGAGVATTSGIATATDQRWSFQSRPAFAVTFSCSREKQGAACTPVGAMSVEFSAPVPRARAAGLRLTTPDGTPRPRAKSDSEGQLVSSITFPGPFPESATFVVELPADLADEAGRVPLNADRYPLTVTTASFPPLAKFAARFGIVESKADATLPVTLRNLEPEARVRVHAVGVAGSVMRLTADDEVDVLPWLRRVGVAKRERSVFAPPPKPARGAPPEPVAAPADIKTFTLPKPGGEKAFEVVGIPLAEPGLYIVELESARLGAALLEKPRPMYVPTAALVTNLSVHFKWGAEQSLAWVTTLDEARPVADAAVTLRDCTGAVRWQGATDGDGLARIPGLPGLRALPTCFAKGLPDVDPFDGSQTLALRELYDGLLVTARKDDDLSFVHSSWDEGIEAWRFQLPDVPDDGGAAAHTILDRPLFRAAETVHMKHLFRMKRLHGFGAAVESERPTTLSIVHVGSDEHYEQPLAFDARGVAESTWTIPPEAKLGLYEVHLLSAAMAAARADARGTEGEEEEYDSSYASTGDWIAASFRVEEFRVPLMKGVVQPPAAPQVQPSAVPLDLAVQYLAGGGAGGLPVVVRAQLAPHTPDPPDELEGFVIANGPVEEGTVRRSYGERDEEDGGPKIHQRTPLVLDPAGTGRVTIADLPPVKTPMALRSELEFRDPSGQVQTVAATVPLWPSEWLVAIAPDARTGSAGSVGARVAVTDVAGKPVAGAAVVVDAFSRKVYSNRTRVVGGFYAYDSVTETTRLATVCRGTTDANGMARCEGPVARGGNVVLEAVAVDRGGRRAAAHDELWVADGTSDWWFGGTDSDRMDVLPERRRYEPGETARLQIRMPFRAATALVTIEREGVVDARVVALTGVEPVLEVPVLPGYAPNVFVSVLAVRGRVGDVQPTALVDLGRPTFKLGIAELQVGWRAHRLAVRVAADRAVYHVRDTARVKIAVRTVDGTPLPAGGEVAVAAVDAGLLELAPSPSWNLLDGMMGRRGYGVQTSTAEMQVVGKRHYGLKAVPLGGGGGRSPTRELFDTLLLWKGRVALDDDGRATVDVPLNDSLTSFRIVAVAETGLDRFGTGRTSIRATQDVMVLPGLPPVVREGDRFRAEVTARNTTDRSRAVTLTGSVEGLAAPLAPTTLQLAAGASAVAGWDVTVPARVERLVYQIEATVAGGRADHVRAIQEVRPAVPVRTLQATLVQLEPKETRQPVARPAEALADRGDVRVALAPSLAAGLDGVKDAMRRYPYRCLEQRVSRAIALRDRALWREVTAALPSYVDGNGLLKYFPTSDEGSEVLTSYVLSIATAAGLELPERLRTGMEEALRRFVTGALATNPPLKTADLALRKLAALEALSRVGAVEPALLGTITVEPERWPTSALIDWWSLLHRTAKVPKHERFDEVERQLRARLVVGGTSLGFSTESADRLSWLMIDPDVNAVRLVLALLEQRAWRSELPRLMTGALARQLRGAWSTTVANAWGTLAVEKFATVFESGAVAGTTTATLGARTEASSWETAPNGAAFALPWPDGGSGDLVLAHAGGGRPWATIQTRAALPLVAPLAAGYRITKTVTPVEARSAGATSRDDVLRVRLEIDAERDMTWVVVNDPVPAGATHVGTGLGRDSALLAAGERRDELAPVFEERAFDGFRAYYDFVPRGRFIVEYTVRPSQAGHFGLPPTRVEALYAPDVFGEIPNAPWDVRP